MRRNLLLPVAVMFVLSSALSAQTVIRPFNGTNLDGWRINQLQNRESHWQVGRLVANATTFEIAPVPAGGQRQNFVPNTPAQPRGGMQPAMINMAGRGVCIYTEQRFADLTVKLEFNIPSGSNSGVYLMGEYEVQIFDSFARPLDYTLNTGSMGGIYNVAAPLRNASGVPGTWQTMEIEFVAPRFDAEGNKTSNAIAKRVVLNGVLIHENVEIPGPTGGGLTDREAPTGPLRFQGTHGRVAFRNIEIIVKE